MTHFEKCKVRKTSRESSREKEESAAAQKRILCRIAANELDEMSKAAAKPGGVDFDSEKSGRKRKLDAAELASPPQRRRIAMGDTPAPDSGATVGLDSTFALDGITASITGLYVSSFIVTIILILPQDRSYTFNESLRAPVFSSRTMDWNLLYPQGLPTPFAVTANVEGLDQSHVNDNSVGLMGLYGAALAISPDGDGPITTV